jgi:hypothetical protein
MEMGKGFTCVKNARIQVPRLILDMILLMKTRLSGSGGEEWNGILLGIGIPGRQGSNPVGSHHFPVRNSSRISHQV